MSLLIVDDAASQRILLKAALKKAGYEDLLLASSAQDAFEQLGMNNSQTEIAAAAIDLILMDINMTGLDGIEACRQIKTIEALRDIPIIMVTGSTEIEDLDAAFEAGAIDYIAKPIHAVELLARVRSVLKLKHEMDQRKARERELLETNKRLAQAMTEINKKHHQLVEEQEKSERLLLNILPQPIAERLKQDERVIADSFTDVTVLFSDIVDFTKLSARISPEEVVTWLNDVFSLFDQLADKHGLEKIKTIGDAYMVVGGLPTPRSDHAEAVAEMALEMRQSWANVANGTVKLRIGMHTGPVVAGVIGAKKFSYDLWGDTVNAASRMESHGLPEQIQVSEETYNRLKYRYMFEERGFIEVKGKGALQTYLLLGKK